MTHLVSNNPQHTKFQIIVLFVITYLEQGLSFARVGISNIFLPLKKCIFLDNLQVIEIYKPSQQHTCKNNLPVTDSLSHGTAHNVQESLKSLRKVDFKVIPWKASFDAK